MQVKTSLKEFELFVICLHSQIKNAFSFPFFFVLNQFITFYLYNLELGEKRDIFLNQFHWNLKKLRFFLKFESIGKHARRSQIHFQFDPTPGLSSARHARTRDLCRLHKRRRLLGRWQSLTSGLWLSRAPDGQECRWEGSYYPHFHWFLISVFLFV